MSIARWRTRSYAAIATSGAVGRPRPRRCITATSSSWCYQGILTIGERTLVADGRQAAVWQFREAIHEAMNAELTGLIEAQTGCHVVAAMSTTDVDRDLAAEVFVL